MHKRRCEAPPTHVYYIKREVMLLNIRYTQYESIHREDVKLLLHISNTNQNIMIPNWNIYQFSMKVYIETLWYQFMIPIENKQNILKKPTKNLIPIERYKYIGNLDTNYKNLYQLKIFYTFDTNWKTKTNLFG